ncbi:SDR family NAD(P)-dependent oxidoreductase [Kibdelosporangium phytohabitans]|uniref:Oxidoreductase n=1 Tax=Kibdelosporangium phytohabitans TaxID=860235 RepID=A0A0N9HTR3_9PSEU|nr:SDR family NAD(P)-dependent oxidoreductase [Kibdelosporangium phytohabitans]ALG08561.1 oxidoreductase [Kibdelosporangium phytohabitans]MBE1470360.1 NAD(P)-dependent dehydrogenase (short-subunit alcohol dehydrogenase family) [Kibdelosporangium phytohabitans]
MKTIVISGGTDGMGRALALEYLSRGDAVVIIGRDADKAATILAASERATFVQADLSLVDENTRAIADITSAAPAVDALVLCARHFRSHRRRTSDGHESTFALEYLSRYLLSHGLAGALRRTGNPVIVNVSGPGLPKPEIRWDDPTLTRGYAGVIAQGQAGRANDLLGVAFAARPGTVPYVLVNPGAVATSFSGEYDAATAVHVERLKRFGKPVGEGIRPIVRIIDRPPAEPLSAFVEGRRISVTGNGFDVAAAERLAELTRTALTRH